MTACNHVVFRGADLSPVIDVAAAFLPVITPELVTDGSRSAVIDPGYREAMHAACSALYESEKEVF